MSTNWQRQKLESSHYVGSDFETTLPPATAFRVETTFAIAGWLEACPQGKTEAFPVPLPLRNLTYRFARAGLSYLPKNQNVQPPEQNADKTLGIRSRDLLLLFPRRWYDRYRLELLTHLPGLFRLRRTRPQLSEQRFRLAGQLQCFRILFLRLQCRRQIERR